MVLPMPCALRAQPAPPWQGPPEASFSSASGGSWPDGQSAERERERERDARLRAPAPLARAAPRALARAAGGKRERDARSARPAGGIFCFLNLVHNFFWIGKERSYVELNAQLCENHGPHWKNCL